jgi:predicted Zn-dependent protease
LHSKVINPKNDKLYAVQELPKLIEQYPEAKAFKNYLYGTLMALGRKNDAFVVLQDTIAKHPDYVFARINYAETLLFDKNPNKAASMLIEPYDVKILKRVNSFIIPFFGVIIALRL